MAASGRCHPTVGSHDVATCTRPGSGAQPIDVRKRAWGEAIFVLARAQGAVGHIRRNRTAIYIGPDRSCLNKPGGGIGPRPREVAKTAEECGGSRVNDVERGCEG